MKSIFTKMLKLTKKILIILCFLENTYIFTCPFCDPQIIARQKYTETSLTWGLYDYRALVKGHCLIVPKRHVENVINLTTQELVDIFDVIKITDLAVKSVFHTKDFFIEQNNGPSVGQTIPHIHFHYLPNTGGSPILFRLKLNVDYLFRRLISDSKIKKITNKLASAISA